VFLDVFIDAVSGVLNVILNHGDCEEFWNSGMSRKKPVRNLSWNGPTFHAWLHLWGSESPKVRLSEL
jgi:hypothetical protein